MKPQICLGTAQFGLDYGVTNKSGKLLKETISKKKIVSYYIIFLKF